MRLYRSSNVPPTHTICIDIFSIAVRFPKSLISPSTSHGVFQHAIFKSVNQINPLKLEIVPVSIVLSIEIYCTLVHRSANTSISTTNHVLFVIHKVLKLFHPSKSIGNSPSNLFRAKARYSKFTRFDKVDGMLSSSLLARFNI